MHYCQNSNLIHSGMLPYPNARIHRRCGSGGGIEKEATLWRQDNNVPEKVWRTSKDLPNALGMHTVIQYKTPGGLKCIHACIHVYTVL
jgi:hypothetical protein